MVYFIFCFISSLSLFHGERGRKMGRTAGGSGVAWERQRGKIRGGEREKDRISHAA